MNGNLLFWMMALSSASGWETQGQDLGDLSLASVWLLTGSKFSVSHLMETRTEPGLLQEHSTFECMLATPCKILQGGRVDCPEKEYSPVARLKVFHEHCLSCWQFCYNHSQHTTLPLSVFICCQLPCSYFVSVLVGDSSFVLWFYSPQTQGILWLGSWMLWDT